MAQAQKNALLNWLQESKTIEEFDKRIGKGGRQCCKALSVWCKNKFGIEKAPHYRTVLRIIQNRDTMLRNLATRPENEKRINPLKCPLIEQPLSEWVRDNNWRGCFISNNLIQTKAQQLQDEYNAELPTIEKTKCLFTRGWLVNFRRRHKFRAYKLHGEQDDADLSAYYERLPDLRNIVSRYSPENVWNCDEFALYYRMAPSTTIGTRRIKVRKKYKTRITFLACVNSNGTEKFPLLVVGSAS